MSPRVASQLMHALQGRKGDAEDPFAELSKRDLEAGTDNFFTQTVVLEHEGLERLP